MLLHEIISRSCRDPDGVQSRLADTHFPHERFELEGLVACAYESVRVFSRRPKSRPRDSERAIPPYDLRRALLTHYDELRIIECRVLEFALNRLPNGGR